MANYVCMYVGHIVKFYLKIENVIIRPDQLKKTQLLLPMNVKGEHEIQLSKVSISSLIFFYATARIFLTIH